MKTTRINEIDVLRFAAALMVVIYHYTFRGWAADAMSTVRFEQISLVSRYGYLGVELFFMISGFVILMSAQSGEIKYFVVSRVVRLYPALWICCSASAIVMILFGGERYNVSLGQYLFNMTLINGFIGVPSVDGVYWSLFVEIQFYVFIAMLVAAKLLHRIEYILLAWLILIVIFSIAPVGLINFIIMAKYGAYFISGATFYLLWRDGLSRRLGFLLLSSMVVAVTKSIGSLEMMEHYFKASFNYFVVFSIILAFYLAMLTISLRLTGSFSRNNWMIIGGLTYPLYLIHQNVGYIVLTCFESYFTPIFLLLSVIVFIIFMSYLINNYAEKPMAKILRGKLNQWVI